MKPGQLIEYTLTNIISEKSCTKCGGEIIRWPFSKKSKLSMSLDQYSKVLHILFLFSKLRNIEIDWPLAFTSYKAFLKKRGLEQSSCLIFCLIFEENMAICKSRHWNLGIGTGIGNGTGIGTDIANAIIFSSIRPMDPKLSRVVT